MRGTDRAGAQGVGKAIAMQKPRCVRADLNAGAYLGLVCDLLVDMDVAARADQGKGSRGAANSTAYHRDPQTAHGEAPHPSA